MPFSKTNSGNHTSILKESINYGQAKSRRIYQQILALLKDFCAQKLDEDYYILAEKLAKKLNRKKNKPLESGQPKVWAAAIIHALGTINFMFDKSFQPYISVDELNNYFGTSKSSSGTKSKQIRDLLKLTIWDDEFSTNHMSQSNPFENLVVVDGMIVPLDSLPEVLQQEVTKARAEGRDISFKTK